MDMKKKLLIGIAAILLLSVLYVAGIYNSMVSRYQGVQTAWSQVENTYQRRADLIPNLVKTVKAYASHEQETLMQVVTARAAAMSSQKAIPTDTLPNPQQLEKMEAAQQSLGSNIGRLLVTVERYPDLKANQNFLALQAELSGTENRIAVERRRFNLAAQVYNTYILQFPHNLMARHFNFKPAAYFSAKYEAEIAPAVEFVD